MGPQNARDILCKAAHKYASFWQNDEVCFQRAMEWMPSFADYCIERMKEEIKPIVNIHSANGVFKFEDIKKMMECCESINIHHMPCTETRDREEPEKWWKNMRCPIHGTDKIKQLVNSSSHLIWECGCKFEVVS